LISPRAVHLRFRFASIAVVVSLAFCLVYGPGPAGISSALRPQADDSLRFDLPTNGNLRVENLRGGVIVDVWRENYVAISAINDSGQLKVSPAVIQRTDGLLSVRVTRAVGDSSHINLTLRIPDRTHAAIITQDGSVEVRGVSSALLVQTVSGEIRVEVPQGASADFTATSKTGAITSSLPGANADPRNRAPLSARLGTGSKSVRLYSQAGNITLARLNPAEDLSRSSARSDPERQSPAQTGNPDRAPTRSTTSFPTSSPTSSIAPFPPEIGNNETNAPGAGKPATPLSGSEEISEGDIIRVDTQLVSVNVSVVDRSTHRGVSDLGIQDFRLLENAVEQPIAHLDSASAPFNLVLLIDLSGSTTQEAGLIKSAALHFVAATRPFDRIGVITFAGAQMVVSPLTADHDLLRQRINAIEKPLGSTKLYDSLVFAMTEVLREAKDSRRNALVVMSDGMDSVLPNVSGEGSRVTYEESIRQAKEFDGVIYSIWVDTQSYEPLSPLDIQQETWDLGHDRMKETADAGGGVFYECEELKDLSDAYDRVVADLGTVYTLSYRPTNELRDGSWRSIKVTVKRPSAVARGKRGYYAR
jgi:VWFA-related protein